METLFEEGRTDMHFARRSTVFTKIFFSTLVVAAMAFAPRAEAGKIDFDQSNIGVSGLISYDGGGIGVGTVSGSELAFDLIKGFDFPFNSSLDGGVTPGNNLVCNSCTLSFTTGTLVAIDGPTLTFGGGSFVLSGDIPAGQFGAPAHPGTGGIVPLATGTFGTSTLTIIGNGFTFSGRGTDEKDTDLVEYYFGPGSNVPPLVWNASTTQLGGTGDFGMGGSFTSDDLTLVDFANTIPEPGSIALVLLGLSGIAASRRRYL